MALVFPERRFAEVPWLTTDQMREVDRAMVEELGIQLFQMMENAGRHLAGLAISRFGPRSATVLAGPGGNGGGGLVAARHLANRGVRTTVSLGSRDLAPVPAHQLSILRAMDVPVLDEPGIADLVLDAVIGYGLAGDPRDRAADLIRWAAGSGAPVLALDVPSGLDTTTGAAGSPSVRATATMTLALPKVGLRERPDLVGELYLADISVPPAVYRRFGMDPGSLFAGSTILRLVP